MQDTGSTKQGGASAEAVSDVNSKSAIRPSYSDQLNSVVKIRVRTDTLNLFAPYEKVKVESEDLAWASAFHVEHDGVKIFGGSGFYIEEYAGIKLFATNYHVVKNAINKGDIEIFVPGRVRPFPGRVIFECEEYDISFFAILDCDLSFTPFKFYRRDSSYTRPAERGTKVTVLGYPLSVELVTITEGVVSTYRCECFENSNDYESLLHREVKFDAPVSLLLQIDSPITNGNSGGPVINADKEVIGIVHGAFDKPEHRNFFNLVIPISTVEHVWSIYKLKKQAQNAELKVPFDNRFEIIRQMPPLKFGPLPKLGVKFKPTILFEDVILQDGKRIQRGDYCCISDELSNLSLAYRSRFRNKLKPDDILLLIDGHEVHNSATGPIYSNVDYSNLSVRIAHLWQIKAMIQDKDKTIKFTVLRGKEILEIEAPLDAAIDPFIPYSPFVDHDPETWIKIGPVTLGRFSYAHIKQWEELHISKKQKNIDPSIFVQSNHLKVKLHNLANFVEQDEKVQKQFWDSPDQFSSFRKGAFEMGEQIVFASDFSDEVGESLQQNLKFERLKKVVFTMKSGEEVEVKRVKNMPHLYQELYENMIGKSVDDCDELGSVHLHFYITQNSRRKVISIPRSDIRLFYPNPNGNGVVDWCSPNLRNLYFTPQGLQQCFRSIKAAIDDTFKIQLYGPFFEMMKTDITAILKRLGIGNPPLLADGCWKAYIGALIKAMNVEYDARLNSSTFPTDTDKDIFFSLQNIYKILNEKIIEIEGTGRRRNETIAVRNSGIRSIGGGSASVNSTLVASPASPGYSPANSLTSLTK